MLRICHILPTFHFSGAGSQIQLLTDMLPGDEFEQHVIALQDNGNSKRAFPNADSAKQSWLFDVGAGMRLRSHLKRIAPDIVHTWQFSANTYGRLAARSAGVKHIVATERAVDRWKVWQESATDRWLARRTDKIITSSESVRAFYQSRGIPADKLKTIPAGVRLPEASAETKPIDDLPADALLIGAAGRLTSDRRLKDLIWACDLLKCIRDDAHLLIFGDGPHRWRLERYAGQIAITDRVHFLGETDQLEAWLPRLHVAWLACGHLGPSSWLLESMAAGIPAVAADSECNREVVIPEQTGFLAPLGDRAAFARWTNVLLSDHARREQMGFAARERAAEHFSAENMVQRHAELYRSLVR